MNSAYFIRNKLKLRHVHVMLILDAELNVSRAAERLNITQAAVSRTLNEVEEGLGFQIFERHARGLRRIDIGQNIIAAMRTIVEDIDALETLAEGFNSLSHGQVFIGIQAISVVSNIAKTIKEFKTRFPNVVINVREGVLPDLIEDLNYGRLDIVYGRLLSDLNHSKFSSCVLSEVYLQVVTAKNNPPPPNSLASLMQRAWILPVKGTPMRDDFEKLVREAGVEHPRNYMEINNLLLYTELLRNSDCLALCPTPLAQTLCQNYELKSYPFIGETKYDPLGIIYSKERNQSPAVRTFLKCQLEQLGN